MCEKRGDTDLDGTLDQQRIMYYSAGWQLLEERIDDDSPFTPDPLAADIDRHVQHMWGPRYIDDIVLHRENNDFTNDSPLITYEKTFYHLTDVQFSTVAVIDGSAGLTERVTYTAYGVARHHYMADVDGDGDVDSTELADIRNTASGPNHAIGQANYDVDQDIDRDGDVTITDYNIARTEGTHGALKLGSISDSAVDNQIGWDGYVFNAETLQYHVRFRCYSPTLGRWIERDPAGYVDATSLYEYGRSNPLVHIDPTGKQLFGCAPDCKKRLPDECCRKAKEKGYDNGDGGGVICCDGRKVACAWVTHPGTTGGDEGVNRIIKCITKHEKDHFDAVQDCPDKCPDLGRAKNTPGVKRSPEECKAYVIELRCLRTQRKRCDSTECRRIISRRIGRIIDKMSSLKCPDPPY